MPREKILIWAIAPLLLAIAVWTGWWFHASRQAMTLVQAWAEDRRAAGIDTHFARITSGGYPFTIALTIDRLGMAGPGRGWFISAERLKVSFRPWRFDHYEFEALAPLRLAHLAVPGSLQSPIEVHVMEGAYLVGGPTTPHDLSLNAADLRGPNGLDAETLTLALKAPDRPPTRPVETALTARLDLTKADLRAFLAPGLPETVDAGSLAFTVGGPIPTDGSLLKRLETWRDGGGVIDVSDISLRWGSLDAEGDGTVTLDGAMRPLASFALRVAGLRETARDFERAGLIDGSARRGIELGAGLLSFANGGGEAIRLPVTIQHGYLSLGPVAVARIPPLVPGYTPPRRGTAATPEPDGFSPPPPPPTVSDETLRVGAPRGSD